MAKQQNAPERAQDAPARKTAEDYAREAAEPFDAARSAPQKPRPVSVTSLDEQKAREGLKLFEIEVQRADGHRSVRRLTATSDNDETVWAVIGDDEVLRVDEVRPA